MARYSKNRDFNEVLKVSLILISTPFSVVIVGKLLALVIGFLFGWQYMHECQGLPGLWVGLSFIIFFMHLCMALAYSEDCKNDV